MRSTTNTVCWLTILFGGIVSVLISSGCGIRSHYTAFPIPHSEVEILGSWVGLSGEDVLYKMVLDMRKTGVLYSQFPSGTIVTNDILQWQTQGSTLTCKLRPSPHGPTLLNCAVKVNQLVGALSRKGGWSESVVFQRDQVLEQRLKRFRALNGT